MGRLRRWEVTEVQHRGRDDLVAVDFPRANQRLTCVRNVKLEQQVASAELELAPVILAMTRDDDAHSTI